MPPPRPTTKRMTANPIKPSRYRPGKAVGEEASSSSASENEEDNDDGDKEAHEQQQQQQQPKRAAPPKFQSGKTAAAAASNLKNLNLEERRKVEIARERAAKEEERRERERLEREAGFVTESESGSEQGEEENDDEAEDRADAHRISRQAPQPHVPKQPPQRRTGSTSEGSESDEGSSASEESSSESDTPDPRLKRPIFVRKADRQPNAQQADFSTSTSTATHASHHTSAPIAPTPTDTAARRKTEQTNDLIQSTIDARLAASAAASKQWDDEAVSAEMDDTDGVDPDLEHAEWVARELARLKRSRAALESREAEIAEVERRRNLSTPEREREDKERIAEQERERGERREAAKESEGYMRRYHHRGAFTAGEDEEKEDELRRRDLMTAEFEGDVRMKGALPKYLQVRDSSMIGRKGRQRHRDLRSEDTGRWGGGSDGRGGRGGGGRGGGARGDYANEPLPEDERFRPDRPGDARGATGANAGALGERKRPYGDDRQREDQFKRPRREELR